MALITRCPHCATTFRVTPLHLQAHRGDVRCGRCTEVFNAFSTLSTIKEPETDDLDQGKVEETHEESSTYQPRDESPAAAVSEQQLPPTSGPEITQAEATAEAGVESVTGETAAPGAELQETTLQELVSPEPIRAETKVPGAVTQASGPEAMNLEAETQEAQIPEAMVSEATAEAPEARVASPDASLPEPPASAPVKSVSEPMAESAPADRDMAGEPSPNVSTTDATSASEKTPAGDVRKMEPSEPANPVGPKTRQRKIHLPGTHADEAEAAKDHAEQQPRAKRSAPRDAASKAPLKRERGEGREGREGEEGDHERKPEKTPGPEVPAASYAFDTAVPNISPAWTLGSLLLLIILTGQTIYFYRAELAALIPAAKPYLEQYCKLLQCSISPPRHPQSLNIESSDMQSNPQHPNVITLNATVRNHASYPQAFPLFELTFIDNQNQPLASRIFKPDAYLGKNADLAPNVSPGNEFNVKLHLDTGDLNAAGYRLSLLYPNS